MRIRVIALSAATVLCGATLAGCGSATPSGKSALSGSSTAPVVSQSPGATPTTAGSGTPTTGSRTGGNGGGTPKPVTPSYASTAKSYATNTVNAYAKGSKTLLDAYTSNGGAVEFANLPKTNMTWHFHTCAPDGTYTACSYDNDNGDELTVDIDPAQLGKPDAAVNANVLVTTYPTTADAMVGEFLQAWQDGNRYRMVRLSSASAVSTVMNQNTVPTGYTLADDTTSIPGVTIVAVHVITSGHNFGLTVLNDKLGHAHAINILAS